MPFTSTYANVKLINVKHLNVWNCKKNKNEIQSSLY